MRSCLVFIVTVMAIALPAVARDPPAPKGPPPSVWLASARKKDATIVVKLSQLQPKTVWQDKDGKTVEVKDGQIVKEGLVPRTEWGFGKPAPKELELGKTVNAIRADGKAASAEEVLKALEKPAGIVCFVFTSPHKRAQPDAFHLALLRADSITLAFEANDAFPPPPKIQP